MNLKPFAYYLLLVPFLVWSGYYAGCEVARGEINVQKLENVSVMVKVVKAKMDVPPQIVLGPQHLEEVEVFANRKVGGEVQQLKQALARKAHYGLVKGQVLLEQELE